ncbi:hypothetical protein AWENTII_009541 [Aspergillus wentii]
MFLKSIFGLLCISGLAAAHMELSWPYPLRSQFDPANNWTTIDYSMTSPLLADGKSQFQSQDRNQSLTSVGSNFPCKGYQQDTAWRATAEYIAGKTYNITLSGSATHGGGSCQLSLSYDNGETFKVIQSMEGGCPLESTYDFRMPGDVADGHALFAWSWFNLEGNREMYMNCADVIISGGNGSTSAFEKKYPDMFVANVDNGCSTVEEKQTVFANPGNQVIYGDGVTASSATFPDCS